MLKLPQFAIKIMIDDAPITVRFKSIGSPKELKVLFTSPSKSTTGHLVPVPKEEIVSWGGFAKRVYNQVNGGETNDPTEPTQTRLQMRSSDAPSSPDSKLKNRTSVLHKVRSDSPEKHPATTALPAAQPRRRTPGSDSTPEVGEPLTARQALPNVLYRTAQGRNSYLARYEGMAKSMYVFLVYFPNLRQWNRVEVTGDYKLTVSSQDSQPPKETKPMLSKTKEESAPTPAPSARLNSPVAKSEKGLTVYEAWGKAFDQHGTKKDAPEQITKFMEESFPNRKTKWAKWVNAVRARYNAGKLPGVAKPETKLPVYKFDGAPARSGKERRAPLVAKAKPKAKPKAKKK